MNWGYKDLCVGSGALPIWLFEGKRAVVPYQGSKWRLRRELEALIRACGFRGPPHTVELSDIGPWGVTLGVLLNTRQRGLLISSLQRWVNLMTPHSLYASINKRPASTFHVIFAMQHLVLQRLSYGGKAVGCPLVDRVPTWKSPGFSVTSALGEPESEGFGEVKPQLPAMIRTLQLLDTQLQVPKYTTVARRALRAPDHPLEGHNQVVYIDPDYEDTTAYPDGSVERARLIEVALAWAAADATVIVSEGKPIQALVDLGWRAVQLRAEVPHGSEFRSKKPEWVTMWAPDFQEDLWRSLIGKMAR